MQAVVDDYWDGNIGLDFVQVSAARYGRDSGMSQDPADIGYPTTSNEFQLYGAAIARRAADKLAQDERFAEFSEEMREQVKGYTDRWLDDGRVMIAVRTDDLRSILDTGEVRNQFQTQTSGGLLHNDTRAVSDPMPSNLS